MLVEVFPVSIPETLTCLTIWKRFNDIKRLRKQIQRRHKELQLRAAVPQLADDGFFRRFDPDVIEQRKQYILRLLDFVAQHPGLYKSHAFLQFFEASHTPSASPMKARAPAASNIASICSEIEVPCNQEYRLIDAGKDTAYSEDTDDEKDANDAGDDDDDELTSLVSSSPASDNTSLCSEATSRCSEAAHRAADEVDCATEAITVEPAESGDHPTVVSSDYIYEAALEFSDAVCAEVGHSYRKAFESYKSGIQKLIEGARNDVRAEQRRVAKDKIQKYLARAEQIHECYLSRELAAAGGDRNHRNRNNRASEATTTHGAKKYSSLEIAMAELAQFKVLRVVHGVMQVQDVRDRKIHIMKVVRTAMRFFDGV